MATFSFAADSKKNCMEVAVKGRGGDTVVWRAILEVAVFDVAARLPQHHRDVSGRQPAGPPASTAPCSASEAVRCHVS